MTAPAIHGIEAVATSAWSGLQQALAAMPAGESDG